MQRKTTITPNLPADLKYTNRIQVIDAFLSGESYSANDISAKVGLSRQTVMKCVQFFLHNGLLSSVGKGSSTNIGGKRPELFTLSREKYFLCITLWPWDFRIHLYNIAKELVDSLSLKVPLLQDPKATIDNAGQLAQNLLEKNHIDLSRLCAVSISTPGIVDYKTGCLKYSSKSPEWGWNVPLLDYLRPYFSEGTLLFLENAGKMTARPLLLEPSVGEKRVLSIFSCWGLSSCLIEKQHILSGKNSLIGEIGHMIIDPSDSEECSCGGRGCLERLVSLERLRQLLSQRAAAHPDSPLSKAPEETLISDIFTASSLGDSLARELVDYLAKTFAMALRNISLVFDPDMIYFQGDYASADEFFDQQLRRYLQEFRYYPAEKPFDILYDHRPLDQLDALGSCTALTDLYFGMPELYNSSLSDEMEEPPEPVLAK